MRRRLLAIVPLATAIALGTPFAPFARAEDPAPAAARAPGPTPVAIDFSKPTPVTTVLDELSRLAGVSISWVPDDKSVTSRRVVPGAALAVKPDRVFDAVRALLAHDEILLVPYGPAGDRMYRAVDARQMSAAFIARLQPESIGLSGEVLPLLEEQGGRFVTTTIYVKHLTDIRDARMALQRLSTQNNIGSVVELPTARAFVVTDFAPNVAAIYRLLQQMDVPPLPLRSDLSRLAPAYFPLKKAHAPAVAILLSQLFHAPASPPSQPTPSPSPSPVRAVAEPAPRISHDQASNQVVVIATPADVATMREIVQHVDVDPVTR